MGPARVQYFLVLKRALFGDFPDGADLIQAADNMSANLRLAESEVQIMTRYQQRRKTEPHLTPKQLAAKVGTEFNQRKGL